MADDDGLDRWAMRLALIDGIGPRARRALLDRFGSSRRVFEATRQELLGVDGIGPTLAAKVVEARREPREESVIASCAASSIRVLMDDHTDYPALLREIPDPPPLLFAAGEITEADRRAVAIVGTRQATAYGLRQADRFARHLVAAGFAVVSGLARGIDASAHRGALSAGGRTIAVLGGGLLRLYPPEHAELARTIRGRGAVVSEAPPERPPSSGNFPQRNRVISGLSLGTLVIEAGRRSGALITARHALEQGREVFAVPGSIENFRSRGCHQLLRDGAKLVETIDDVLDELDSLARLADGRPARLARPQTARTPNSPPPPSPIAKPPAAPSPFPDPEWSESELAVWNVVGAEPTLIDDVIAASGLHSAEALAILGSFELRKAVRRIGGARVRRAP
ncbi:MAG: DNA-protecting protein DprA [Planctomycetes bacterium]|nr:DNA-protecting protein DprA [Planctomycetota bacterium]